MEGTVIPLAIRRSRRSVVGHFCALHALSAEDAVEYVPARPLDRRAFERLLAKGIVHQTGPRHYWIDLVALKADEDDRRTRLVSIVIALSVAIAAVAMLFYRG